MNTVFINEQQLQSEINALKPQFPDTKDIYREVCVLLFFRYGITPTANKLYQYVRRGSMSAPADALNKFWLELREKSRVRIERPDIPENIGVAAGDLIMRLWNEAQKAAQDGFSQLIDNATSQLLEFKLQADTANQNSLKNEVLLIEAKGKLENALKHVSETDYLLSANTKALTKLESSFKALETERDRLNNAIFAIKTSFSKDLSIINLALNKAEDRYKDFENRSHMEIDKSRQQALKLEKELSNLRIKSKNDQSLQLKALAKLQDVIAELNKKVGNSNGIISELKKQRKLLETKLARLNNKVRE